jgi:hypothetical protein
MESFKEFYSKIKMLDIEQLKEILEDTESQLRRLELTIRCCESKIERVEPFSDEFEEIINSIDEAEKKRDIISRRVAVTRVETNQRVDMLKATE